MRISDWSSDVCSSDLRTIRRSPESLRRPIALRQRSDARGQAGFRESKGTNTERKIFCRWSCFGALISERRARAVSPGLAQSPSGLVEAFEVEMFDELDARLAVARTRSEEHTSELQSLMRI